MPPAPEPEVPPLDAATTPPSRLALADGAGLDPRLSGLMTVSRVIASAPRLADVLALSADAACKALDAASVSLSRLEGDPLLMRTLVNAGELSPGEEAEPLDEVYPVSDFREGVDFVERGVGFVCHVDDPDTDPAERELLARLGKASCVIVPIVLEGRTWGEFYASRRADQPRFAVDDIAFAAAVSAQIAAGIAQAAHTELVAELAYSDALTGLANRRDLERCLDAALDRHRRLGTVVTLLMCDVNGLKRVNDERGHEAGDRLLVDCADLLRSVAATLTGSLAARLGGDEFALLVEHQGSDAAVRAAEELCERALGLPGGHGLSCGVASTADLPGVVDSAARLLRVADAAQYRAKRGRSRAPVVAGRRLPAGLALALPSEPSGVHDRRLLARSHPDGAVVLESVLAALDAGPAVGAQARLELTGDVVAGLLDASCWFVSRVAPGSRVLETLTYSRLREEPVQVGFEVSYDLGDYPVTAAAVRGGSFVVLAGAPGADPGEDALLVASGFDAVLAAGSCDAGAGWLLEVFTDAISARPDHLAPAMRAAVAVAVHQGPGRPG